MGDKKRKEIAAPSDQPVKKSKKSKKTDAVAVDESKLATATAVEEVPVKATKKAAASSVPADNAAAATSKKARKRAADFMDEVGDAAPDASAAKTKKSKTSKTEPAAADSEAKKPKKPKKSKKEDLLTADGVNGVLEHEGDAELKPATANKDAASSMQAEAERTVDHELEDEFGDEDDDDDNDNEGALLAGFDSDSEDDAQDVGDLSKTPALPNAKKTRKKLDKASAQGKTEPGAVYVGRIPHGFYEKEMREYFTQFGEIRQLRLSRNKRTGRSKHFAFVEFASDDVAKIVAETMDNYLLFGHILKCKYAPAGTLHPDTWKGANKKYRKIPHDKIEREKLAAPKSVEKWEKKVKKEQRSREKKAKQLKAIGIEMPMSTLTDPASALAAAEITNGEAAEEPGPAGAIEPPPGVPKDEVAVKEGKKSKKGKKSKELVAEAPIAATATEPVNEAITAPTTEPELEKTPKKNKKSKTSKKLAEVVATESVTEPTLVAEAEAAMADEPAKKKSKKEKKPKKSAAAEASVPDGEFTLPPTEAPTGDVNSDVLGTQGEAHADAHDDSEGADGQQMPSPASRPAKSEASKPVPSRKQILAEKRKAARKAKKLEKKLKKGPKLGPKKKPEKSPRTGKFAGIPALGKDKYNKAKRDAVKAVSRKAKVATAV